MSDEIVMLPNGPHHDQHHITRNRFHTLCGKEIPHNQRIVFHPSGVSFATLTLTNSVWLCGLCVKTLKEENQFLTQRVEDEESGTVFLEYEEA
tara:strand:- start:6 stop:284 length:279 start_codon:yes stop_codon:yes gene_type:complete